MTGCILYKLAGKPFTTGWNKCLNTGDRSVPQLGEMWLNIGCIITLSSTPGSWVQIYVTVLSEHDETFLRCDVLKMSWLLTGEKDLRPITAYMHRATVGIHKRWWSWNGERIRLFYYL